MTNLSRRSFLTGALVLTAAASVPMGLKALETVPTLYGDGIRDDTKGLTALFNGEPVRMWDTGEIIRSSGREIILREGTHLISDTVVMRNNDVTVSGAGAKIVAAEGFRGKYMIDVKHPDVSWYGLHFDSKHLGPASIMTGPINRSPRLTNHRPAKKAFAPLHKAWESPFAAIGRH